MKFIYYFWLTFGGDCPDTDGTPYRTKRAALDAYADTARELDRYGQRIEATIHIARMRDEVVDCPDFVLSLGPRGGVRCERC